MTDMKGRVDFELLVTVTNANANGDPLDGNRPRKNLAGYGEISSECIKRKIRNRLVAAYLYSLKIDRMMDIRV